MSVRRVRKKSEFLIALRKRDEQVGLNFQVQVGLRGNHDFDLNCRAAAFCKFWVLEAKYQLGLRVFAQYLGSLIMVTDRRYAPLSPWIFLVFFTLSLSLDLF